MMQHAHGGQGIFGGSDLASAVHHQEVDVTGNRSTTPSGVPNPPQGMFPQTSRAHVVENCHEGGSSSGHDLGRSGQGRLPKLQYLVFMGEDPQLWRSRCENYFDMYGVESSMWVRVAYMHMEGAVARWFQSVEHKVRQVLWSEFCALVDDALVEINMRHSFISSSTFANEHCHCICGMFLCSGQLTCCL
jgi:hypothetical protein